MSEQRRLLALVVGAALFAPGARAQVADYRPRLARAQALVDSLKESDARARREALERSGIGRAGPVAVMIREGDPSSAVASGVWKVFRAFGAFPDSALARFVLVEDGLAQAGQLIAGRRAVTFGRPGGLSTGDGAATFARQMSDNAIWAMSRALLTDTVLADWLGGLDPRQATDSTNPAVVWDLAAGRWSATRGCLNGVAVDCMVYLGIERQPDLRRRYPIPEIRADLRAHAAPNRWRSSDPVRRCMDGDDDACAESFRTTEPPAGMPVRYSVIAFVRQRFGPAAIAGLVADRQGTIGDRIARATGERPEALAQAWRNWALDTARSRPVQAGVLDVAGAVSLAVALLLLASRSGRWRA